LTFLTNESLEFHPSEHKQKKLVILLFDILNEVLYSRFSNICLYSLKKNILKLGVIIKRETLYEEKIIGPLFEEKYKCAKFLKFWGDAAKCVRKSDGTFVLEATFMSNKQPNRIVEKMIVHLLKIHCGLKKNDSVKFYCETIWKVGGKLGFNRIRNKLEKKIQKWKVTTMVLPNKVENPLTWVLTSMIVKRSPMMTMMKSLNLQVASHRHSAVLIM
jgi:hypothetical protein